MDTLIDRLRKGKKPVRASHDELVDRWVHVLSSSELDRLVEKEVELFLGDEKQGQADVLVFDDGAYNRELDFGIEVKTSVKPFYGEQSFEMSEEDLGDDGFKTVRRLQRWCPNVPVYLSGLYFGEPRHDRIPNSRTEPCNLRKPLHFVKDGSEIFRINSNDRPNSKPVIPYQGLRHEAGVKRG